MNQESTYSENLRTVPTIICKLGVFLTATVYIFRLV